MCMTAFPAKLSKTVIYAGSLPNGQHVLAYQNNAETWGAGTIGSSIQRSGGLNAMIFPIPAKSLSRENAVDATSDSGFLRRMDSLLTPRFRSLYKGMGEVVDSRSIETFKVGSYEVVVSKSASLIQQEVLQRNSTVEVNPKLLTFLEEHYPGWPIVVAFWEGSVEAEPIVFRYDPLFPDVFVPGLDGHGAVPTRNSVQRDHVILTGHRQEGEANSDKFKLQGEIANLVARDVSRKPFNGKLTNGDWWVNPKGQLYSQAL